MTSSPDDLRSYRSQVISKTGLTDPNSVGIVGDGIHRLTGGYHEGKDTLVAIGVWGPVGSSSTDYSVRLQRDHDGCTNSASAIDIGYQWPHGGNAAWVRWNNMLASQLRAGNGALSAIRAINYWNGSRKIRIDRQYGWSEQSTSDSVDIHTHLEFYRDTEGRRSATLGYLLSLMDAAIANRPAPSPAPAPAPAPTPTTHSRSQKEQDMDIKPGYFDLQTGTGVETYDATPPYGGNPSWQHIVGYLRLKGMGAKTQLEVWHYAGGSQQWVNHGMVTVERNGPAKSVQLLCGPDGGGWLVRRIKIASGDGSDEKAPVVACVEETVAS